MKVKVRPINIKGRPLFTKERQRGKVFAGELKMAETRLDRFGRGMTTATVVSTLETVEQTLLEIHDAAVLSIDKMKMRMRGFEEIGGVQYAQSWDVEIL
jgi:hypothetical protein